MVFSCDFDSLNEGVFLGLIAQLYLQLPNEYQKTGWGCEGNFYNLSFNWFSDNFIEFFYKKFMGLKQMCFVAGGWEELW